MVLGITSYSVFSENLGHRYIFPEQIIFYQNAIFPPLARFANAVTGFTAIVSTTFYIFIARSVKKNQQKTHWIYYFILYLHFIIEWHHSRSCVICSHLFIHCCSISQRHKKNLWPLNMPISMQIRSQFIHILSCFFLTNKTRFIFFSRKTENLSHDAKLGMRIKKRIREKIP